MYGAWQRRPGKCVRLPGDKFQGVVLSNGYLWKKHRKFTVTHLRYFGEGQRSLENYIKVECSFLCEAFKEEQGKPFNPHYTITNAVGNIISSVLFGHRFEYTDGNFRKFLELDNEAILLFGSPQTQLYNVFPSLFNYLPGPHQTVLANYKVIELFLQKEVQKHQEKWNPDQPRDYVDMYLAEMDKMKDDPQAGFNIESLVVTTLDLMEAGTETTATTLRWALVYMMHYPEIQKKVQAEIDNVIGQSRQPAMSDRPAMPYTEAVIYEIQRLGNIVPLGFPKMANKEASLGGYIIPKVSERVWGSSWRVWNSSSSSRRCCNASPSPPSQERSPAWRAYKVSRSPPKSSGPSPYLADGLPAQNSATSFGELFANDWRHSRGICVPRRPSGTNTTTKRDIMLMYGVFLGLNVWGVLLLSLALVLLVCSVGKKEPPGFPRGPLALPLLGNVFNIAVKQPHTYLTQLADTYGNVFCIRVGQEKTLFVCGWKMVKEVLVTQADAFADRPHQALYSRLYNRHTGGLLCSNGKTWRRQRHFAMGTLRTFGLANGTMERSICRESQQLHQAIRKHKGEAFEPAAYLNSAVANIICQVVFGRRFDYSDPNLQQLHATMTEMIYLEGSVWALLYDAFPALMQRLPGPHNRIFSNFQALQEFICAQVKSHKSDLDPSNPRDYIDAFLVESKDKAKGELGFTEENLVLCCLDLFIAGTETSSKTLQWGLIFLIQNPQIQDKVQAEIERVIGPSRFPEMADRAHMPYTNAVIHEIQRMANIIPLNGTRMATKDTQVGEYVIPKGSTVLPILTSVLFDKNEWETPHSFNPGHFLDADGNFVKRNAFLPFSAGKRACLGEALARMELFLFLVGMLQKFTFSTVEGVKLSTEGIVGMTRTPYPFKICAETR
ncbi:cytochrome P450 2J6-like isoform X2 [Phyllopteryx taeniolatus]|uniref:cytochrome P450 2J6-like isoform X2 n=1 Tax=Phyllopteryx taeniolatus TaxID=161469 RepID=UPI002AD3D6CE|nr:cytochrome P450 2J6-like isoform X2 [Phyllopteryx taeniolatus]